MAEAATCTHPTSAWVDTAVATGSSHWSDTHEVEIIDKDTGKRDKYTCTRWYQMVQMMTYCGDCGAVIGVDWVAWATHSLRFCPSR